MAIYLLIVFILNGINACFKGKSKIIFIMTQILLVIMFSYMSIYSTPQDSAIYQAYYIHPEWDDTSGFEQGFLELMSFSRWIGFSYLQLRLLIALFGYFLIAVSLYRMKVTNKSLFYLYYILMPFMEDPIQIRNFLMTTMVLFGFTFLINKKKSGIFAYTLIVLLSSTIQSLGLLFLLIIPFYAFDNEEKVRKAYLNFTIIFGIIFAIPFTRKLFSTILGNFSAQYFGTVGQKIATFLYRAQPGMIIFTDIAIVTVIIYLLDYIRKIFIKNYDVLTQKLVHLGTNLAYSLLATIPLYFFAYNFDRMIKDSLFLFFIVFAVTIPKIIKINGKRGFIVAIMVLVTIMSYSISYYSYGTGGRWRSVVYPVIFDNQFGKEFSDYD